jgi:hypothetical protein
VHSATRLEISSDKWAFARDVVQRLKIFNDITAVFSGTNYVTTNAQLLKICEAKMKIKDWSSCGHSIIESISEKMIQKFDKYWKDIHGPMGIATILDPLFKTDYLLGFFEIFFLNLLKCVWIEFMKLKTHYMS